MTCPATPAWGRTVLLAPARAAVAAAPALLVRSGLLSLAMRQILERIQSGREVCVTAGANCVRRGCLPVPALVTLDQDGAQDAPAVPSSGHVTDIPARLLTRRPRAVSGFTCNLPITESIPGGPAAAWGDPRRVPGQQRQTAPASASGPSSHPVSSSQPFIYSCGPVPPEHPPTRPKQGK